VPEIYLASHRVYAIITAEFLQSSKSQGNDLVTPSPTYDFQV
jgi:uncharacterized protein (DUF2237 family)